MAAATNRATKLELVTRDIEERGAPQCRQQNFTEAMTTGGRSAAGFGRSAAGVRVQSSNPGAPLLFNSDGQPSFPTWALGLYRSPRRTT